MNRLLLLLALACAASSAQADGKLSPEARHLLAGRGAVAARTAPAGVVSAYIHLAPGADASALAGLGVEVNLRCGDILTARVPVASLAAVASLPGVEYVQAATPVAPMMDVARPAARVDLVQQGAGLPRAYDGTGVVVGIIDSGFDYTHPAFYSADRSELRIKRVWEQGYDGGTPPEGFTYGGEFDSPEEILAAAGDITTNTHGTHVAGIAAGADTTLGSYQGVATGADIVLVSISGVDTETNVNISDAISYIYRYAESVGKPCVVNMSLGAQVGPHDGTSTFDVLSDAMQGPGRLLVGSIGNFGATKLHASMVSEGEAPDTLRTFVDYLRTLTASDNGGTIDIWGDPGMDLKVNVFTYNTRTSELADSFSLSLPAGGVDGSPEASGELRGSIGEIEAYGEVSPLNGKAHVQLYSHVSGLRAGYEVGIEVITSSAGTVNVWGDGNYIAFTSCGIEGYSDGDTSASPAEIGGTGSSIVTVGAYVTRSTFDTENSGTMTLEETVGDIASFSCCGPTADGRMKPDVAAPGCAIVSSASSNYSSISSLPVAGYFEWNDKNYYYAYMQGTSMSSPFVAGVLATWLEANPQLAPADVRGILSSTASADEFTGAAPGNTWGYGKIDAWAGILEAIDLTGISAAAAPAAASLAVVPVGGGSVRVSSPEAAAVAVSVYTADGRRVLGRSLTAAEAQSGVTLSLQGLAPGLYVVRAASASQSASVKVAL